MMIGYQLRDGRLAPVDDPWPVLDHLVWLDLVGPDPDQIRRLEALLEIDIPSQAEMEEIEVSSRLYEEDGTQVLTVTLPARAGEGEPEMAPVTFVLTDSLLITLRSTRPRAFETFTQRAARADLELFGPGSVLVALFEAVVDRLADLLESCAREIDAVSRTVFGRESRDESGFDALLTRIGRQGDLLSNLRESLMTLARAIGFLGKTGPRSIDAQRVDPQRIDVLGRDVQSITEQAGFLAQKVNFLLDATLGMISIEQNRTIKIFSVLAVIFMPPTMIASIYGMNFRHMPELSWPWGYPLALALMLAAALLPYWWFRRKGWF
ncbi:MAG: magnesium/cobalt transporter CorA [Wenzhouxiangellaceae bacterium]